MHAAADPGGRATDPVRAAHAVRDPLRLAAVAALGELTADPWCEELTRSAVAHIGAPVALVSIVEHRRQSFVGAHGLVEPWHSRRQTLLSHSFCQYVVGSGRPLVVTDARRHPVLHDNAAITDLDVIAYAGAPIVGSGGHVLGAFCVIDRRPRTWTAAELDEVTRCAARCSRHLSRRCSVPPPAPHRRQAATDSSTLRQPSAADVVAVSAPTALWDLTRMCPAVRLDARPAARGNCDEVVFTGRQHTEPVDVHIRTADTLAARQRFARRIRVHAAFGPVPPPVAAGAYRWSDNDRVLVLRGGPGTMLHRDPGTVGQLTPTQLAGVIDAAVQLSTWRPDPLDASEWQIDYHLMIDERRRQGRLTDDEARRLRELVHRCGPVRTFAHGSLTPSQARQLPSGRITLVGFDQAGMYLPAHDLATLYLALAHDDHPGHRRILHRVIDVDTLEPFVVNLMLTVTVNDTPCTTAPRNSPDAPRMQRWSSQWKARLFADRLLRLLTDDCQPTVW